MMHRILVIVPAVVMLLPQDQVRCQEKNEESCRHCTDKRAPSESRKELISGCEELRRTGSLTLAEAERYCRWVVRVAPATADRARRPAEKTKDQIQIEGALGNFQAMLPAEVQGDRASVLARSSTDEGKFSVIWLSKRSGVWEIESVMDGGSGMSKKTR